MNLLLSRHGNTFNPGEPSVWAGATNDLPLVEKGLAQAERLAETLISKNIKPAAVYCSPLQRTSRYASIVIERLKLNLKPIVDPRLHEIDYGAWTGLTNDEISRRFGEAALKAWDDRSQWPARSGWGSSETGVIREVRSFAEDLIERYSTTDTVLIVSSNGRLRYFLTLAEGEFARRIESGTFKIKTGHVCKLRYESGAFKVEYWDQEPRADLMSV